MKAMTEPFKETPDGVLLLARVLPRSARSGIVGIENGAIKIKLSSPPIDGRANDECIEIIARELEISKSGVEITAGQKGRDKTILLRGAKIKDIKESFETDGRFASHGK